MQTSNSPKQLVLLYLVIATSFALACEFLYPSETIPAHLIASLILVGASAVLMYCSLRRQHMRQQTLLQREERLNQAMESAQEGLWDWDIQTGRVYFSAHYCQLIGETQNSMGSHIDDWRQRIHPDDSRATEARLQPVIQGQEHYYNNICRLRHRDGSYRWIQSRGQTLSDKYGQPSRVIGTSVDITQTREDASRLRQAAAVFDSTLEGVLVTNHRQQIVHINRAFSRITGYSADEVLGKNPVMFKSGRHDKAFYQRLWGDINARSHWQGEIWNRRKNGEVFPMWQSIRCIRDENDVPTHYVAVFSDISAIKESQNEIDFLAHHDPLTALPNRLLFCERIEQVTHRDYPSAVMLIDLDHFATINESFGHSVGDQVLKMVGERLNNNLCKNGTLARLGGDEFAVLYEHCEHTEQAALMAQTLIDCLSEPFLVEEQSLFVSASIGISLFPLDGSSVDALIRNADSALVRAKHNGRTCFAFYSEEMTLEARERVRLEAGLRQAIEQHELRVHYQPIVDLAEQKMIGVEALVRWQHPEHGMVPPMEFISFAEESGLIAGIDSWVLGAACQQMRQWLADGIALDFVAVNISSRMFARPGLVEQVQQALQETGLQPCHLELEVTESAIMDSLDRTREQLQQLRNLGVRLSIDDFGTGYSSLARLKRLPLDKLKIDQSFVRGLPHDENDTAIACAVLRLGQSLGLDVLAEGIETPEQATFLREHGCNYGQGYFFGRPQPVEQLTALLPRTQG